MTGRTLALPAALIFVAGLALMYFALRGLDAKHNLLGGKLAGTTGATPTDAQPGQL
jgi:hypothetical protein